MFVNWMILSSVLFLFQVNLCSAFVVFNNNNNVEHQGPTATTTRQAQQHVALKARSEDDDELSSKIDLERRNLFPGILFGLVATTTTTPFSSRANAQGDPRLFRPNPLANRALEQIRIWDQDVADNIKYGGELEKGDAGKKVPPNTFAKLLVPIVVLSRDLTTVNRLVTDRSKWEQASTILSTPQFQKLQFKKTFNAYGDNIYYKDTDRANLYLGGGATPQNEQSVAYLLRNDILTNVEALQAELEFLLRPETSKDEQTDDLVQYAKTAQKAMDSYLGLVSPKELQTAMEMMKEIKS